MKKKLALLLALVMVCATMLTACSKGDSDISGTAWELTKMETGTGNFDAEQLKANDMNWEFEFKKDGTVASSTGDEITWKQDGNTVTMTDSTGSSVLKVDGDKMTLEQDGAKLEFNKKK